MDNKDKSKFYVLASKAASEKGEEWFNSWSRSNPIDNFMLKYSDEELSNMILNLTQTDNISFVDYKAMKTKLEADIRGN